MSEKITYPLLFKVADRLLEEYRPRIVPEDGGLSGSALRTDKCTIDPDSKTVSIEFLSRTHGTLIATVTYTDPAAPYLYWLHSLDESFLDTLQQAGIVVHNPVPRELPVSLEIEGNRTVVLYSDGSLLSLTSGETYWDRLPNLPGYPLT